MEVFLRISEISRTLLILVHCDQPYFAEIKNSDVWGQISRKLHVGFPRNVVCKTL